MEIIILGTGCVKCNYVYNLVEKVITETGANATLRKEGDIMKIMEYKVMRTPAVVIDGEVVFQGLVPSEKEVAEYISTKQ
jgi:hypothetical protein